MCTKLFFSSKRSFTTFKIIINPVQQYDGFIVFDGSRYIVRDDLHCFLCIDVKIAVGYFDIHLVKRTFFNVEPKSGGTRVVAAISSRYQDRPSTCIYIYIAAVSIHLIVFVCVEYKVFSQHKRVVESILYYEVRSGFGFNRFAGVKERLVGVEGYRTGIDKGFAIITIQIIRLDIKPYASVGKCLVQTLIVGKAQTEVIRAGFNQTIQVGRNLVRLHSYLVVLLVFQ
ncbi:hypothetical protein Barb7_01426 [Bacteroidales bacterium Barb7]|nr:hypothetical protein Barb7_01426 [Bacteroidales bacterium Barb7]